MAYVLPIRRLGLRGWAGRASILCPGSAGGCKVQTVSAETVIQRGGTYHPVVLQHQSMIFQVGIRIVQQYVQNDLVQQPLQLYRRCSHPSLVAQLIK